MICDDAKKAMFSNPLDEQRALITRSLHEAVMAADGVAKPRT